MKSILPFCAAFFLVWAKLSIQAAEPWPKVEMKPAFPALNIFRPLWLGEPPDGTHRLFVAQQDGRILLLPKARSDKETKVFLDITERKPLEKNEEGLLSFAFHPQFKQNRKFYVYYSQQNPKRSVISEFLVSATNPDMADKSSERIIWEIPRPDWNHGGGQISFGPDGYLYLGMGDGGGRNDQYKNAQKTDTWLAKILRIDVDTRTGNRHYGIPQDNPFVHHEKFVPETWAWGLRNPWRFSFDRQTGELYCADVGQDKWEEIHVIKKGDNCGWSFREGFHEFGTNAPPVGTRLADPILEYPHFALQTTNHTPGLSVTGGYVYRGRKLSGLQGVYLYGDFVSGTVWGLRCRDGKITASGVLVERPAGMNPPWQIASFGEDGDGEIYVLTYEGDGGKIYELVEKK